ncbi:hypothetical protein PIB30_100303 [Stylosanthes scabra]|uniref:Uncharacterized protein n=1 Tax=Stylosanthes scabra TaxID=79078 RepID=A0ABU6TWK4_9FABA|nr:hypothetical protein [Stylosanthes scabra]
MDVVKVDVRMDELGKCGDEFGNGNGRRLRLGKIGASKMPKKVVMGAWCHGGRIEGCGHDEREVRRAHGRHRVCGRKEARYDVELEARLSHVGWGKANVTQLVEGMGRS